MVTPSLTTSSVQRERIPLYSIALVSIFYGQSLVYLFLGLSGQRTKRHQSCFQRVAFLQQLFQFFCHDLPFMRSTIMTAISVVLFDLLQHKVREISLSKQIYSHIISGSSRKWSDSTWTHRKQLEQLLQQVTTCPFYGTFSRHGLT